MPDWLYACAWLKSWFDMVHYMWICVSPHHNKRKKKTRNTGTRSLVMVEWLWLPNCVRQRWVWNFTCLLLGIDIDRLDWMGFGWQILLNGLHWMRRCFCWTLCWILLIGFGCLQWRTQDFNVDPTEPWRRDGQGPGQWVQNSWGRADAGRRMARALGRGPSGSADGRRADGASVQPAAVAERRFGLRECLVGPRGMGFVLVWAGLMNSYDTSSSI
jgi:hypothetical protein